MESTLFQIPLLPATLVMIFGVIPLAAIFMGWRPKSQGWAIGASILILCGAVCMLTVLLRMVRGDDMHVAFLIAGMAAIISAMAGSLLIGRSGTDRK